VIQQVNLYHHFAKQKQAAPVFHQYLYGLIFATLLLIGFSLYLWVSLKSNQTDLQLAKQNLQNVEKQINLLQQQYPKQTIDSRITQEIAEQQKILSSLSQVIHLLNDKDSDQSQGFSRYFSALARQSIADVWLSNIHINAGTQSLLLKGSTFYSGKVPVFLKNLQLEATFQGKSFENLIMLQAEKNLSQLNFTISTVSISEESEAETNK